MRQCRAAASVYRHVPRCGCLHARHSPRSAVCPWRFRTVPCQPLSMQLRVMHPRTSTRSQARARAICACIHSPLLFFNKRCKCWRMRAGSHLRSRCALFQGGRHGPDHRPNPATRMRARVPRHVKRRVFSLRVRPYKTIPYKTLHLQ